MNRWLFIRRLRGPAFLILFGITALLNQWGVLSFTRSWPLYLILAGLLALAERAATAGVAPPPFPGQPYGQPYVPAPSSTETPTSASGASSTDIGNRPTGGNWGA